jgi:hypothetical protein
MKLTTDIGTLALAIWLILFGLLAVFNISFANQGLIMGILALVAGVLLLVKLPGR